MRINPLDGIAELGATLRTVVLVHEWHVVWREPFVGWGTYLASIERLILGRGLDYDVVPAAMDPRVFNAVAMARSGSGGIGGSPLAEAYHAAGLLGVLIIMTLIGMLVAWLDARPPGSLTEYLVGMLGYILLVWSRNDVAPVHAQVGFCFAILLLARLVDALIVARSSGPVVPRSLVRVGSRSREVLDRKTTSPTGDGSWHARPTRVAPTVRPQPHGTIALHHGRHHKGGRGL